MPEDQYPTNFIFPDITSPKTTSLNSLIEKAISSNIILESDYMNILNFLENFLDPVATRDLKLSVVFHSSRGLVLSSTENKLYSLEEIPRLFKSKGRRLNLEDLDLLTI